MTFRALGDRGSVTAEFAIALPAVVVVLVLGVGILGSAATAVRLQHETTEAARLLGRGDDAALAAVTARGGTAAVEHREGLVCVSARAPVPVALSLPPVSVRACALDGGR